MKLDRRLSLGRVRNHNCAVIFQMNIRFTTAGTWSILFFAVSLEPNMVSTQLITWALGKQDYF